MGDANTPKNRAAGASVASIGLTIASDITAGEAKKSALEFQADRAERAAEFGKVQANLTDTTYRERLNTTLQNIDVMRAAGGASPLSPTAAALESRNRMLSDRQRLAAVSSINAQVSEDLASADYLRKAGDFAVKQSYLTAATDAASAIAKAIPFSGG